jgi:hypothetical protein
MASNFSIKAESLFLIIIGQKCVMEQFINIINNNTDTNNNKNSEKCDKYILTKINCPSSHRSLELMKELNNIEDYGLLDSNTQKSVIIDDGLEFSHGYVYADGEYNDNHYILQVVADNINHYTLGFLKFPLDEDDNPELIIEEWFKSKLGKIPSSVKKTIKLITVAGSKSNILVISSELKKI